MPVSQNTFSHSFLRQPKISFRKYLLATRENRNTLLFGLSSSIIIFLLFKLLYPYPDFFSDSYNYLAVARLQLNVGIWPVGYSWFLSVIHWLNRSAFLLVFIQYLILVISLIYLFFTLDYFYTIRSSLRKLLLLFCLFNPLLFYLSNTVNSDALFATLSFGLVSTLIWIIHAGRKRHLIIHALLLVACFTVRNNAYYYPVISLMILLFIRRPGWYKWSGILLFMSGLACYILWTKNESRKLTGFNQYSLFTGWQLANNALYFYDEVQVDSNIFKTPASRELNRITSSWFTRVDSAALSDVLDDYVGNFFIRQPDAPLKQYFSKHYVSSDSSEINLIKNWARTSADFEPFGKALITHYPGAYAQYFVGRNLKHYFLPPLSHIGLYNYGEESIDPIAKEWFGFKEAKVHAISPTLQSWLGIFSGIFLLINFYFLWYGILNIKGLRKLNIDHHARILLYALILFALLNFGFSIAATSNILRYQVVPMYIMLATGILIDTAFSLEKISKPSNPANNAPGVLAKQA